MLTAIRQWVVRTMMKVKGETGIVKTLPKKEIVEINTQITAQRLMENGIDPQSLKNADQVENAIIAIENRPKVQQGIRSTKSADVFDLKGKKIKDTDNIMGGEELPPPGSRGGPDDIAAPVQSSEETMKNMLEAENRKNISKMRNRKMIDDAIDDASPGFSGDRKVDAELVAENLAERMGKVYDDLPTKERLDLYDQAFTALSKTRDDLATGGRAGFANGSKGLLDILNIQAEGSKSGKQQIPGAPEGFTIDSESYNIILNADIPINEKINLLTKYGRGKGRDRIEKDDQELFVGEGGSRIREIGLDFNPDAEKGFGGNIMYDPDNNNVKGGITYKFAGGGRAGFSKGSGLKSLFNFLNENNPVQAYKKYLKSVENRMKAGKELEVAGEVVPIAASGALVTNQMKKILKKMNEEQKKRIEEEAQEELRKDMKKADGGIMRLGLKEGTGMTRRTFLKLLGGMAAVPIVGKFFKLAKVGKTVTKVPMIKTDDVAGKPEWFDALVNKVIVEGDDVTKKFATGERQSIHQKTLDDGSVVRVTEDVDDGAVRVEYQSEQNVFGDDVQLQYKKPLPDEGDPRPTAEFTTAESGPVGRSMGPDDYEIDVDEVGGTSIRDLDSDVSKLKEYATGKKLTMKEIVESKKRRDKAKAITEDPEAQSDAVIRRQGDADDSYYGDDYARGGIARMLGE